MTNVLLGRFLEARAKRRSGAALQVLLALGAKDVAVLRDCAEVRSPVAQLAAWEEFAGLAAIVTELTAIVEQVAEGPELARLRDHAESLATRTR